jgi:hypothetical protein
MLQKKSSVLITIECKQCVSHNQFEEEPLTNGCETTETNFVGNGIPAARNTLSI